MQYIRWHWRHSVNGGYRRHAGCILYIAAMYNVFLQTVLFGIIHQLEIHGLQL